MNRLLAVCVKRAIVPENAFYPEFIHHVNFAMPCEIDGIFLRCHFLEFRCALVLWKVWKVYSILVVKILIVHYFTCIIWALIYTLCVCANMHGCLANLLVCIC